MKPKNKCWIITKNPEYFEKIGDFNYCTLEDMSLPETIAYDSETEGLNCLVDDVFSIQIGTGKDNYLIDLQKWDTPLESGKQIFIEEVFPYLENRVLIAHNMDFDISFLYKKNFYPERIFDTMVASQILHNGDTGIFSHSFGAVMERELKITYDKTEQKNIYKSRLSTQTAIEYCFNDVDLLLNLHNNLLQKVTEYGALESYLLNCDMIKAQAYMEMCGLPLDTQKWSEKMATDQRKSLEAQELINEYIYENLPKFRDNQYSLFDTSKKIKVLLSSPQQVVPVFEELGINVIDDKGKKSISENVINKTKHEFVDMWLKYKESEHRVSTFGESVLSKVVDGRIYSRFRLLADTARMVGRSGEINFLNFPADKETRSCFVAKKGFKIIVCDYDGQENLVLASETMDENLLDNVLNSRDAHSKLAREIYPELKALSDSEIKKNHSDKRQVAKVAGFAISFGASGWTLSKNLNFPLEEGNKIYEAYKNLYTGIFTWGEENLKVAIENGYVESAEGFKLKLPNYNSFIKLHKEIKEKDRDFWSMYRVGKDEYTKYQDSIEENRLDKEKPIYKIENRSDYDFYMRHKPKISEYFKMKSSYFRTALNFPIQSRAAFQSKKAMINLFNFIKENGHLWRVKVINFIYDEINLEVEESLCDLYKEKLSEIMKDAANQYLNTDVVKSLATANVGESWYEAK